MYFNTIVIFYVNSMSMVKTEVSTQVNNEVKTENPCIHKDSKHDHSYDSTDRIDNQ